MILVTGATGFLGEYVIHRLVSLGFRPMCFVRPTSDTKLLKKLGLPLRYGNLGDAESLAEALRDVQVLVNLASLGFGHAPSILDACRVASVPRGIFISTTAIFTTLNAASKTVRIEAERLIRESQLEWTILRPTMIYGSEKDRNMTRLVRYLARFPIIPVLGSGERLQQPVHVEDVASAVVAAIARPTSFRQAYDLSGKNPLSFHDIVDQTAAALGRRVWKVQVPLPLAYRAVWMYGKLVKRPVVNPEQVLRLNEDKIFSHAVASTDLDFRPRSFTDGIRCEVERMRSIGMV